MKNKILEVFGKKGEKVMEHKQNPYFNHEAYADPTAYYGMKSVVKEEDAMEKQVSEFVHIFKMICHMAGFEIVGRIQFRHKKSGRRFD